MGRAASSFRALALNRERIASAAAALTPSPPRNLRLAGGLLHHLSSLSPFVGAAILIDSRQQRIVRLLFGCRKI